MRNSKRNVEILAPCGSYEILIAAIYAGADACYIGGNRFGARAYAENFDEGSIIKAINYAHIHGVKIYLTVNTLFKDKEIQDLYDYLLPFYEAGLDAVIVQDLGAFLYIRHYFPDLPIHCSTQMNITSPYAARMMRELGATRVVTAREMSIDEIRELHNQVDMEIETFVHGAMCYSYSGQCLMSSLAGGRSGNRGRCAQPCRKCYDGDYVLSLKDMCTLEHIPELIEAGVYSLKIEGRMKNAYYVASAVHAYREIVDLYFEGKLTDKRIKELRFELANVFNRGNFSDGYMKTHNSADMISIRRPNNQGVMVGEITHIQNGAVNLRLSEQLYKQDVLEILCKNEEIIEVTTGVDGNKGQNVLVNCPKTKQVRVGSKVYRTRCNHILSHIEKDYIDTYEKIQLQGKLDAHIGENLCFTVNTTVDNHTFTGVCVLGIVEKAKNKMEDLNAIKKPLSQLGNTDYEMKELDFNVDDDSFIPKGLLKQLRREAILSLEDNILSYYQRKSALNISDIYPYSYKDQSNYQYLNHKSIDVDAKNENIIYAVSTYEQLEVLFSFKDLFENNNSRSQIILEPDIYEQAYKNGLIDGNIIENVDFYLDLPYVIRHSFDLSSYLQKGKYSGIYIRNIDGLAAVLNSKEYEDYDLIISASLYCYNGFAYDFYKHQASDCKHISFEMPRELSVSELLMLSQTGDMELILYEYPQVMITANCLQKTKYGCNQGNHILKITDDKGNDFYGRMRCKDCINVIYNGIPFDVTKHLDNIEDNGIVYRNSILRFTIESKEQVTKILSELKNEQRTLKTTAGHLFRGVE